jgi:hypothetical protein
MPSGIIKDNTMITQTHVLAAYGRNYKSVNEALIDWNNDLDFKIYCGPYCSKRDFNILDSVYVIINGGELFKLQ